MVFMFMYKLKFIKASSLLTNDYTYDYKYN